MDNVVEYDPLEAPEPEEWLGIDEAERIRLALDYHRRARASRMKSCTQCCTS